MSHISLSEIQIAILAINQPNHNPAWEPILWLLLLYSGSAHKDVPQNSIVTWNLAKIKVQSTKSAAARTFRPFCVGLLGAAILGAVPTAPWALGMASS
jgi:hypothetical protein